MSIDPRTMKSLLQLQLAPSLDIQSNKNNSSITGNGSTSLFNTILSQQLSSLGQGGTDSEAPLVWSNDVWAHLSPVGLSETAKRVGKTTALGSAGQYDSIIEQASLKYGVDESLIKAVIQTESGYDRLAQSHAGAKGLMQLMDGTASGLGVTDSFDPVQNIDGGTRYLSLLLHKYKGHEQVALAAYNAGPGRVDRLGIATNEQLQASLQTLPQETQRYIDKVLQARE